MSRWRGNPWAILIVLSVGFFMTPLDITIVNIAIPDMVDRLGASLDNIRWVVNAYTLASAVLLITAGRLGDLRAKNALFIEGVGRLAVQRHRGPSANPSACRCPTPSPPPPARPNSNQPASRNLTLT